MPPTQKGVPMTKDESREIVYGMPYDEWRAKYQKEASPAQKAAFEKQAKSIDASRPPTDPCAVLWMSAHGLDRGARISKASANNERASKRWRSRRRFPIARSHRLGVIDGHCAAAAAAKEEQTAHRFAKDQLKAFVERVERLEEEKKAIADDIRDVYAEAKGNGFDVKALRAVVRLRKQDVDERKEQEAILETYLHALGMLG